MSENNLFISNKFGLFLKSSLFGLLKVGFRKGNDVENIGFVILKK